MQQGYKVTYSTDSSSCVNHHILGFPDCLGKFATFFLKNLLIIFNLHTNTTDWFLSTLRNRISEQQTMHKQLYVQLLSKVSTPLHDEPLDSMLIVIHCIDYSSSKTAWIIDLILVS